jgi:hypothetical protein
LDKQVYSKNSPLKSYPIPANHTNKGAMGLIFYSFELGSRQRRGIIFLVVMGGAGGYSERNFSKNPA